MPQDTLYVAPDALSRLSEKQPKKVFTFDFTMTGQLAITARTAAEAYQKAIMWSKEDLAEIADLEMSDPDEGGAVQ